jgi:hypothetical protein
MVQIRWRLWLPVGQVLLAVALSLIGKVQTERRLQGNVQVWDYIAPAEIVLHSINYPAAVATGMTVGHRTFQIGIEYSARTFVVYLVYIVVFWYAVGWCVGKCWPVHNVRPKIPGWLPVLGVLGGGCLLLIAFGMLFRGPYALLLVGSAFLWSALFLLAFSTMFAMRFRVKT